MTDRPWKFILNVDHETHVRSFVRGLGKGFYEGSTMAVSTLSWVAPHYLKKYQFYCSRRCGKSLLIWVGKG